MKPGPRPVETPSARLEKAIALLKQIKHQSVDIEGEGRRYKSEPLVRLSHEIDVACTDALNALYGLKV